MERLGNLSFGGYLDGRNTTPLPPRLVDQMMHMTRKVLTWLSDSTGVIHYHLEMGPTLGAYRGDLGGCSSAASLLRSRQEALHILSHIVMVAS